MLKKRLDKPNPIRAGGSPAYARNTSMPLASGRCGAATRNAAVAPIMATSAAKVRIDAVPLTSGS
jgi:hypothetical protein